MILDKLNPVKIYKSLSNNIEDLINYSKYKKIILELQNEGKLTQLGLTMDSSANLYIGIDLNPELLLYSETSQESVELKLISEKLKKYTDFLTKEGILDSIKMDYDRIKNEDYYGYVLQIKYDFKKFKKASFIYDISYFSIIFSLLLAGAIHFL
jgi:hypothetical protein